MPATVQLRIGHRALGGWICSVRDQQHGNDAWCWLHIACQFYSWNIQGQLTREPCRSPSQRCAGTCSSGLHPLVVASPTDWLLLSSPCINWPTHLTKSMWVGSAAGAAVHRHGVCPGGLPPRPDQEPGGPPARAAGVAPVHPGKQDCTSSWSRMEDQRVQPCSSRSQAAKPGQRAPRCRSRSISRHHRSAGSGWLLTPQHKLIHGGSELWFLCKGACSRAAGAATDSIGSKTAGTATGGGGSWSRHGVQLDVCTIQCYAAL